MSIEEVVADRLAADSAVAALVGARVWQLVLPQDPILPAVRVQLISEPKDYHLRGDADLTQARVQVDCYGPATGADPYAAVVNVAEAVNDALTGGAPFTVGDRRVNGAFRIMRRALYEAEELRLVRVTQDFEVFSETV